MLISVILKQVRKLFCQSRRYDSDGGERRLTRRKSLLAVNSPKGGKFPSGGGDSGIIEGERGRLKGEEREKGFVGAALEMFSQPDCINICVPSRRLSPYVEVMDYRRANVGTPKVLCNSSGVVGEPTC